MAGAILPTLSEAGYVTSNTKKLDYLMSYFYESQYSQSQFYYGAISSMSYLLYMYGNDPAAMASEVESTLTTFLSKYISNVQVECSPNITDSVIASINIGVQFTDEQGNPVTLSNLLMVSGNKIVKVLNANNTGTVSNTPIG